MAGNPTEAASHFEEARNTALALQKDAQTADFAKRYDVAALFAEKGK